MKESKRIAQVTLLIAGISAVISTINMFISEFEASVVGMTGSITLIFALNLVMLISLENHECEPKKKSLKK